MPRSEAIWTNEGSRIWAARRGGGGREGLGLEGGGAVGGRAGGDDGDALAGRETELEEAEAGGDVGGAADGADANLLAAQVVDGLDVGRGLEDVGEGRDQ